ncbi:MAG: DUF2723 domain-containing protein [Edaphocola sp.]
MMNFRKINNLSGWVVFALALAVYLRTMERTVSFWDCGEFLATAYRLEVGHSPGAPLFMLLGRLFGMFAAPLNVAACINSLSALTSASTILFLFWTITHFARKMLKGKDEDLSMAQITGVIGAGTIGALAYTFSDTFWFSAVEAEVYATSSFFTAIVFWAILKWEDNADAPHADRWLILISYLMGLSIGVHLLNLLAIPALAMVYYFRRYRVTMAGGIVAFVAGCVLLGFVQVGLIQGIPILASKFELLFVNSLGLPLDSGALFFMLLLVAVLVAGIVWAKRKGKYLLHTGIWCVIFAIVGYSSYVSIIIRSRADVPIDMTNPDDVLSLVSYLQREQYGAQPVLSGPDYNAVPDGKGEGKPVYAERKNADGKYRYEEIGTHFTNYTYPETRFFPRIWDAGHASFYERYLGLAENDDPTSADNYSFFLKYQMNWMWWRYFLWNYAGRQNDYAGTSFGEPQNGNWISGINAVDKAFGRGDFDKMPVYYKENRAHNKYYFLPLILGILGLVFQFNRNRQDGAVVGLLFFFTGIAIVIYLNNTPQQPRERDYAYAGATYAFAIWIGLGVLVVKEWLEKFLKKGSSAALAATALSLILVPTIMAAQNWDDHDRSKKSLARSTAYNVLSSCDSNAILFVVGDNDTYPLWYMQEIEGYRTDVRIVNLSLAGIDWYIDQLGYKINDADAVPMIWKPGQYEADKRNVVIYRAYPGVPQDQYMDLAEVLNFAMSDDPRAMVQSGSGDSYNIIPTQNVMVRTDKDALIKNGWISVADSARVQPAITFKIPSDQLTKSDLLVLNILAGVARDGWKRPIYFSTGFPPTASDYQGLLEYVQLEGMANKIMPYSMQHSSPESGAPQMVNTQKTSDLFLNKFLWGGSERNDVYFDEKNKVMMMNYRFNGGKAAEALLREGKKAEAIKLLDKISQGITYNAYPYDQSMWSIVAGYYQAGAPVTAKKYADIIVRDATQMADYITTIGNESQRQLATDIEGRTTVGALQFLAQAAMQSGDKESAAKWAAAMQATAQKLGISLK